MKAIQTGEGTAFLKAVSMLYPKEKRLVEDPYAEKLLSPLMKFFILLMRSPKRFASLMNTREKATPGVVSWLLCRFRYIDDVLKKSIADDEIKAVVNLGSGMECRAYYIPGVQRMGYFEVDHPEVIKKKKVKIKKILGELPDHVRYVPVDFETQSLADELKKAGYHLNLKTLFIWEGVSQYISKDANDNTMRYVAQAAPGSTIAFTYILKSFIDGKNIHDGIKTMYKNMRKTNNPLWIFGLDPAVIGDYLSHYSLSLIEDIGSDEMVERYLKSTDPGLTKPFEIERIILAKVKG